MGIKSDIEDAIHAHGAWKTHFRDFLNGKAGMDISELSHTDACKLGHWLEDEGRRMMSLEDYTTACELHAKFHAVAGNIVHNIKQKNFSAAHQALVPAGTFDQASHELGAFLRKVALHERPKAANKPEQAKTAAEPQRPPS